MAEEMQKELLSVREAAEFLGISESTVRRYIANGRVLAYRLNDARLIRIRREDLEKLLCPIKSGNNEDK